ncbi:hypothetical protein Poli38472_011270 [Pythium oligandrum]|uniref:Bromo domain-containing protein n=1 Tax=Pythium oligandrum TaxID=41045 RepID=A0A8K1FKZ0_PYTOL|nr:hypothetical protein Poli38472_011270 [Pythium oligandrum]|eukprot:TMW67650.1 hypothetical protein Poli38472_011270 [Pythium oligandrum]
MSAHGGEHTFKLKLKLTAPLVQRAATQNVQEEHVAITQTPDHPVLIGARGGAALKELLSTAPNPEEAIRSFQSAHGLHFATKTTIKQRGGANGGNANGSVPTRTTSTTTKFAPAEKLLDLLQVGRSGVYGSLLDKLMQEMLLRINELSQEELQRVLEATFPYIEFRELRKIPIAILARQEETPEMYLRELTENRRILNELPVHVRRKIMHVDKQELHYFVEQCTQEYIQEKLEWYHKHPGQPVKTRRTAELATGSATPASTSDLWNVSSHMPSPSSRQAENPWFVSPEERRRQSSALAALTEMIGDSESLYLSTLDILQEYIVAANIPGSANTNPKDYVEYVPFLGSLRCDLANLQRDKTTSLLRTDPLHKFIWFLDRAVKNQNTLDVTQLHELLTTIKKLRVGDLPLNKRFKKSGEIQEEEENFEIVLGPPPVEQLLSVLDKIAKADARMVFAEPVPDDVPNYRDMIKDPMDLSTMRKKVKKGKYKTLEMFTDDFNLMINNCLTFNPDTTIFYKEAKRVNKRGHEIIDKNAVTLRGEPQRIRAKKRKKSGPAETMTMLTSTGVVTIKDFGDVDQTGMVPEGMCEETLADVAMILSDPHVKQMICDTLLKTLVACWQKRELPTDNLVCRGLVQLLQIGNPASVRRMLRKKDFVLRAPQVVTMRVVLPLLIRSMTSFRIGMTSSVAGGIRDPKVKDDLGDASLWENMLRASSVIRSLSRAFILQCFRDHHADIGAQLLRHVVAVEDELVFRDCVFLHALGELVLVHVKAQAASHSFENSENANATIEALKSSSLWKHLVDHFFVATVESRTQDASQSGSAVVFEGADEGVEMNGAADNSDSKERRTIKSFCVSILHEKTAMLLGSAMELLVKSGHSVEEAVVAPYVRRTLGALRQACATLEDFQALWDSEVFATCRESYEPLLSKCPRLQKQLFSAEMTEESDETETMDHDAAARTDDLAMAEPSLDEGSDKEAGEVEEGN